MIVKSMSVTDYSTGSEYRYGDQSGNWQSIVAVDGKVNGNSNGASNEIASVDSETVATGTATIPPGVGGTRVQTGYPWVATRTAAAEVDVPQDGIPSGWVITSEGKVVPASVGARGMW